MVLLQGTAGSERATPVARERVPTDVIRGSRGSACRKRKIGVFIAGPQY